ncbi:autotransporter-associated beta strand repeat-containing protein [Poriferisphaera sp. WC338]|uniref:autotransporter-associated beta strand repeat-containing protein n=1 Tax=Poriferisphaera sp. WC338 TaxID=3425129 RepID=UPI003D8195CC
MKRRVQSAMVLPAALAFITSGLTCFTILPASAATYTWEGDTHYIWTFASNWRVDGEPAEDVPDSDDIVVFEGASINNYVYLNGDRTIRELIFGGNSDYHLAHFSTIDTLTLANGNLTATGAATHTIKYYINLGSDGIWSIDTPLFQVTNTISGSHSLAKTGSGTLALTGDNTYSGGTFLNEGTLQLNSNNALGTGLITVQGADDTPTLKFANGVNIANDIKLLSDLYIFTPEGKRDVTYHSGVISGDSGANLIYNGDESLALIGNNIYLGNTIIESGTLQIGNGGTTGWISGNIENHATLEFNRSDDITYHGVLSGLGDVYQFGSGTLTLTGDSNFGRLLSDGGHLVVDDANINLTANTSEARLVTRYGDMTIQNGANVSYIGASRIHNALTVTGRGTLLTGDQMYVSTHSTEKRFVVEDDAEVNIGGFFTIGSYGPGHISVQSRGKLSTGRFIIKGTSTGLVTGSDSKLTINSNLFLYDDSGLAVNDGGEVEVTGYTKVGTPEGFTIDGGTFKTDQLIVNDASIPTISISSYGTLVVGTNNGSSTYQGLFHDADGTSTLTKTGSGTFTMTGGTAGSPSSINRLEIQGGHLVINDGVVEVDQLTGSETISISGDNTLTVGINNGSSTFGGLIQDSTDGPGEFIKTGGRSIFTLTGDMTHTGGTIINAGLFQVGNGGTTGSIQGDIVTHASLEFYRSNEITHDGVISGSGDVTQYGSGTLTFTNNNSYSGGTWVYNGTLLANNTTGSATGRGHVSVFDSSVLGGNGSISGRVYLYDGAVLAPGQSAGHLTIGGIEFYDDDTIFEVELGGLLAGTEYDVLSVLGDAILESGPLLEVSLINGFTLGFNQQFNIMDISGVRYGEFDGLTEGALVNSFNGIDLYITYQAGDGNDIALYTAAIPEPATFVLLGLGGLALVLRGGNRCTAERTSEKRSA